MAASNKAYKYSVELNVHAIDAPGTRLSTKGELYINICLLGVHQRTRLTSPRLPMHVDQRFYFDKIFKSCYDSRDIIQRLEREHILIELLQSNVPSPILLASYETSAKDFLYPASTDRIQYTGLRRYVLLSRTIEFPGISPSMEFTVSPSVDDVTGIARAIKTRKQTKPVHSYGKSPKRSKSPTWKPSSAYPNRSSLINSANVSRSLTSHTISSAVKNDYAQRDTQQKLRELAIPGEVKYVVPIDKTAGRQPFVVRHVDNSLIGRRLKSHIVLNDGLVVNDYSLSRPESSTSLYSHNNGRSRSRSVSPYNNGRSRSRSASPYNNRPRSSSGRRARSPSLSRRSLKTSHSVDFERRGRSRTPQKQSNLYSTTTRPYDDDDDYHHDKDDEYHSSKDCDICRLHRIHSEQSRRAKSLEQHQFTAASKSEIYSPDIYSRSPSRHLTSPTLVRDSFRYRYRQSPAADLSDKVIHTLRHNLESYSSQPWHNYYSAYRYSDGHVDDDDLLERSRRLTQA